MTRRHRPSPHLLALPLLAALLCSSCSVGIGVQDFPYAAGEGRSPDAWLAHLAGQPPVDPELELPYLEFTSDGSVAHLLREPTMPHRPLDPVGFRRASIPLLAESSGVLRRDGSGWSDLSLSLTPLLTVWTRDLVFPAGAADPHVRYRGLLLPLFALGRTPIRRDRIDFAARPALRLDAWNLLNGLFYRERNNIPSTDYLVENERTLVLWGLGYGHWSNPARRLRLGLLGIVWYERRDLASGDSVAGVLWGLFGTGTRDGRRTLRLLGIPIALD